MKTYMRIPLAAVLPSLFLLTSAHAAPVRDGPVEVELVSAAASLQAGTEATLALRIKHDPHWHTYWVNPGTGFRTTLDWTLPPGYEVTDFDWPTPKVYMQGDLVNYVYEGELYLPFRLKVPLDARPAEPVTLKAIADWLMCDDKGCVPGSAELEITLPVRDEKPLPDTRWSGAIAETLARLPRPLDPWPVSAQRIAGHIQLQVTVPAGASVDPSAFYFFSEDGLIDSDAPQTFEKSPAGLTANLTIADTAPEDITGLKGVLRSEAGWGAPGYAGLGLAVDAPFQGAPEAVAVAGSGEPEAPANVAGILGLAFAGGLILNLMPCVFPVLGIKILGFVNQAGESRKGIFLHGLTYTLGVLVSFWALAGTLIALRAGGQQLGWGFQLQSAPFVFALVLLLFMFALNLSGLFEFGTSATAVGGNLAASGGLRGSFFSGVLATVVATPCAAPFLAPALGAALTLPAAQSMLLFSVIGVGLASPYLLLSVFPQAVRLLPRPGAWMETFKQFMAFPLYATVGFLLWVLSKQVTGYYALLIILFALVLAAMSAWTYGRFSTHGNKAGVRAFARIAAVVLLAASGAIGYMAGRQTGSDGWQEWSHEKVAELRAEGRPIYVDFTAAWCTTCIANKTAVFTSSELNATFEKRNVAKLKADWTNKDPKIKKVLESHGRAAVPMNLLYLPGRDEPILLPELLTAGIVLDALDSSPQP